MYSLILQNFDIINQFIVKTRAGEPQHKYKTHYTLQVRKTHREEDARMVRMGWMEGDGMDGEE